MKKSVEIFSIPVCICGLYVVYYCCIYIWEKNSPRGLWWNSYFVWTAEEKKILCLYFAARSIQATVFLFYFILTCVLFIIFLTWFLLYFQFNVSDRRQNTIKNCFYEFLLPFSFLFRLIIMMKLIFFIFILKSIYNQAQISFLHQHLLFLSIILMLTVIH